MTENEIKTEIKKKPMIFLGFLNLMSLITIVVAFFILIWGNFDLAWKVGLSGIVSFFIISLIANYLSNVIDNVVDEIADKKVEEMKDNVTTNESAFAKRLREAIKNSKN